MSEATRRRVASLPPEVKVAIATDTLNDFFDDLVRHARSEGLDPAAAARKVRGQLRRWQRGQR